MHVMQNKMGYRIAQKHNLIDKLMRYQFLHLTCGKLGHMHHPSLNNSKQSHFTNEETEAEGYELAPSLTPT